MEGLVLSGMEELVETKVMELRQAEVVERIIEAQKVVTELFGKMAVVHNKRTGEYNKVTEIMEKYEGDSKEYIAEKIEKDEVKIESDIDNLLKEWEHVEELDKLNKEFKKLMGEREAMMRVAEDLTNELKIIVAEEENIKKSKERGV